MEAEEWFIVRQEEAENLRKKEVLGEFHDSILFVNVMIKHRNCYYHKDTIHSNESSFTGAFDWRYENGRFGSVLWGRGEGLVVVAHGQRSCPKLRYSKTCLLRSLPWAAKATS